MNNSTNTSNPKTGTPVMDTREASQYLGLSASWLQKARTFGLGPPFLKIGTRVLYRRQALDDWLTEQEWDPETCRVMRRDQVESAAGRAGSSSS